MPGHDGQPAAAFEAFAREHIAPYADQWDRDERLPDDIVGRIAGEGYLGALVPQEYGGLGLDMVSFGALNEALGAACTSVRSLVTAHGMVCHALRRWGSQAQRQRWLPELASGRVTAAFALTETGAGSDIHAISTQAVRCADGFTVTGEKSWITCGQSAGLFLVFADCGGQFAAFLIEAPHPGNTAAVTREPVTGLLGARASGIARLRLRDCHVPPERLIGPVGFGLSAIAGTALDLGRYCVAWGCVGMARAAADASIRHASARQQFGAYLRDHQLVAGMVADMLTKIEAARLLCLRAGQLRDSGDERSVLETCMAKYLASTVCRDITSDAVQIHGASGCGGEHAVQRFFRDAKIMEIIEGSSQMQQVMIARQAFADPRLSHGQHR